jgi:hypothetical protein
VSLTLAKLAAARGLPAESLGEIVCANAIRFFRLAA